MNKFIAVLLIFFISIIPAYASDLTVRARKLKKPVQIAYVKKVAPDRWEIRYGPPENPNEHIYHFNGRKRILVTEFCEFEFVWR